jgi:hypothetical protein
LFPEASFVDVGIVAGDAASMFNGSDAFGRVFAPKRSTAALGSPDEGFCTLGASELAVVKG